MLISDESTVNFCDLLQYFGIPSDTFTQDELNDCQLPTSKLDCLKKFLKMPPSAYVDCKENFLKKVRSGDWSSMMDQLKYYNILDCKLLQKAWLKYTELFFNEFAVDAQQKISLSQLAQTILFKHYPKTEIPIITIGQDFTWLSQEIRGNLFGGLAAVFCRHAQTTADSKYPEVAYKTPNGDPVKKIQQLDVNSLYPTVMKFDLPVGSGLFYENENGNFIPREMSVNTGGNASNISLHWLNHMQSKFVSNGKVVHIQCQLNGQEKKIANYDLDGYVFFENKQIGLDFRYVFNISKNVIFIILLGGVDSILVVNVIQLMLMGKRDELRTWRELHF